MNQGRPGEAKLVVSGMRRLHNYEFPSVSDDDRASAAGKGLATSRTGSGVELASTQ